MKSFKLLEFYNKPIKKEITEIASIFSVNCGYKHIRDNIYLFNYNVEYFMSNRAKLKRFFNKFYFLIMTDYKFLNLLKKRDKFNAIGPVNIKFRFDTGENLNESQVDQLQLLEYVDKNDIEELDNILRSKDLHISQLELNMESNYVIIDEYSNIYAEKINNNLKNICVFVLEGKIETVKQFV